jgi:hypothetical protein
MMYQPRKYHDPFRSVSVAQPTDIVEQRGDDGYMEEVTVPKPRKENKYLPGEKLLLKLKKQRDKEQGKNRAPAREPRELDMGTIQQALSNIIAEF